MRLKTILNKICNFKGFIIEKSSFAKNENRIDVKISHRKGSKGSCSKCGKAGPTYDHRPQRAFEFIPIWGFSVFFIYSMRRIKCSNCGIKVEQVPWADGKQQTTKLFQYYLSYFAKMMSWKDVSSTFKVSWDTVYYSVAAVVRYGLAHRDIGNVTAIGVDEVLFHKNHKYVTLVYDITSKGRRLLWVGQKRTKKTLRRFFADTWNENRKFRKNIEVVCSDMWKAYLSVIKEKVPNAFNILDKFHIIQHLNKAVNQVRIEEMKKLKADGGTPVLTKTKWIFLKKKINLTKSQKGKLKELTEKNIELNTLKAYILKEEFQRFWTYKSPTWAGKFLDNWCELAKETKLNPMIKVANMLQNHRVLILNYFITGKQYNSGIVEGLNRKVNLTIRKGYGYRTFKAFQIALYHQLGDLPEPTTTHSFF